MLTSGTWPGMMIMVECLTPVTPIESPVMLKVSSATGIVWTELRHMTCHFRLGQASGLTYAGHSCIAQRGLEQLTAGVVSAVVVPGLEQLGSLRQRPDDGGTPDEVLRWQGLQLRIDGHHGCQHAARALHAERALLNGSLLQVPPSLSVPWGIILAVTGIETGCCCVQNSFTLQPAQQHAARVAEVQAFDMDMEQGATCSPKNSSGSFKASTRLIASSCSGYCAHAHACSAHHTVYS